MTGLTVTAASQVTMDLPFLMIRTSDVMSQ
jgi:hypothetical protein